MDRSPIIETNVCTLESHIMKEYNGDPLLFCQKHSVSMLKVERWINNNTIWLNNAVYLKKTNYSNAASTNCDKKAGAVSLREHIKNQYSNNATAFAKSVGTTQQQVSRWRQLDTVWYLGQIYHRASHFRE